MAGRATQGVLPGVRRARNASWVPAAAVVMVVLLGNAAYLLGIRTNDPLVYHSGLGSPNLGVVKAPFAQHHGAHTLDPNDGWTAQALGRLSAEMWVHGHVPLWNLHEGLGAPLAGEMQSAAFLLPFVLLNLLPNGIFLMHVALELIAGLTMLGFLRALGISRVIAAAGGALFALNGTFSVMTNAPFNPIAFLPMAMWGVELLVRAVRAGRRPRAGVPVIAVALAWMLYAGFPETALLEFLLVGLWTLVRVVESAGTRRAVIAWSALAAVLGAVLSAPILVALKDFLSFAYTAYHSGGSSAWSYDPIKATAFALPYAGGPMGVSSVSGGVAGFVTLAALFCAILGLCGSAGRARKLGLAVPAGLLALDAFGFSWANRILNLVPGMKIVLVYKYGLVIIAFAVIVLAAFGLQDLRRGLVRRRSIALAGGTAGVYLAVSVGVGLHEGRFARTEWASSVIGWTLACLIALLVLAVRGGRSSDARRLGAATGLAALVLVLDNTLTYAVPQLSAGSSTTVDTAPVEYLQKHLGTSRFFSLGPIQPNYGSYWGLSQLNVNDLPVPQAYVDFVNDELRPRPGTPASHVTGWAFTHGDELAPLNFGVQDARAILRAYGQQQGAYRRAGVRYLVMGHGVADGDATARMGLRRVFSSRKAEIWEDPAAEGAWAASAACVTRDTTLTSAVVTCRRSGTLTRHALAAPGWRARAADRDLPVRASGSKPFQEISVPAGTTKVTFTYRPAHFYKATAASAMAGVSLAGIALLPVRRRRPQGLIDSSAPGVQIG